MDTKTSRWEVLWAVQKSQRYHARRNAFFDRWNKATAFVGVVGGSTVIAALGKYTPDWFAVVGAAIVVVMSGVDLVAGTGEMARRHNDLRRRFCEMEASIARQPAPTEQDIAGWQAQRLNIEADEPPVYVALDILCENELARAYAHLKGVERQKVPWYKAVTAQLMLWPNT